MRRFYKIKNPTVLDLLRQYLSEVETFKRACHRLAGHFEADYVFDARRPGYALAGLCLAPPMTTPLWRHWRRVGPHGARRPRPRPVLIGLSRAARMDVAADHRMLLEAWGKHAPVGPATPEAFFRAIDVPCDQRLARHGYTFFVHGGQAYLELDAGYRPSPAALKVSRKEFVQARTAYHNDTWRPEDMDFSWGLSWLGPFSFVSYDPSEDTDALAESVEQGLEVAKPQLEASLRDAQREQMRGLEDACGTHFAAEGQDAAAPTLPEPLAEVWVEGPDGKYPATAHEALWNADQCLAFARAHAAHETRKLQQELSGLREEMRVLKDVQVTGLIPNRDTGEMVLGLEGGMLRVLAACFVDTFKGHGAKNWLSMDFTDREGDKYTVTMQKATGVTPASRVSQLEKQLLEAGINPVPTGADHDTTSRS